MEERRTVRATLTLHEPTKRIVNSRMPFQSPFSQPKPPSNSRSSAVVVFLVCLVLGAALVAWRARSGALAERSRAQTVAEAQAGSIEMQLRRPARAAELLAMLAQQSGGIMRNFQAIGARVHSSFPELSSLALEPAGIVTEIVPRAGNERAIGQNVFKDPANAASATAALQRQTVTVAAPVPIYRGGAGVVARAPIFQKTPDGANQFWGFVAAFVPFNDVLRRANLQELSKRGYDHILLVPGSGTTGIVTITRSGISSVQGAIQQTIRVQNLELRLAVRPRGGWINLMTVTLESVVVLVFSALIAALVHVLAGRREAQVSLASLQTKLNSEETARKKTEENLADAKAAAARELEKTRALFEGAQSKLAHQDEALRVAAERQQLSEAAMKTLEVNTGELQVKFDQASKSAQQEISKARAEIGDLRAKLKVVEQNAAELNHALEVARQRESLSAEALAAQEQKTAKKIADLEARLESQKVVAQEAAAASAAKLKESKALNEELRAALKQAEGAQKRVAELQALLEIANSSKAFVQEPAVETTWAEESAAVQPEPPVDSTTPVDSGSEEPEQTLGTTSAASEINHPPVETTSTSSKVDEPVAVNVRLEPENKPALPVRRKGRRRDQSQIELFDGETAEQEVMPQPETDPPKPADCKQEEVRPGPAVGPPDEKDQVESEPDPFADWPEIDGLSRSEGLARKHGAAKRYLGGLRDFVEKQHRASENIQEFLLEGDMRGAARAVQSLQDAADDVGAEKVSLAAEHLSKSLQGGAEPDEIERKWSDLDEDLREIVGDLRSALRLKEEKPAPAREPAPEAEVDPTQLRRAANEILPLLADRDPGAKDCFKANRMVFRLAFSPAGFEEFEQLVKRGTFEPALEHLRKAVRKHGISI